MLCPIFIDSSSVKFICLTTLPDTVKIVSLIYLKMTWPVKVKTKCVFEEKD